VLRIESVQICKRDVLRNRLRHIWSPESNKHSVHGLADATVHDGCMPYVLVWQLLYN
jgi:hypothetical protein